MTKADVSIRFKNQDYEFPLFRDPQTGKKAWRIWDTSILPPMFTTDRPLFAHIPPETEQLIEQNYFYGGMGEEYFDADSYRYYNAPGADARRKGAVLCGPRVVKSTITVVSTAPSITNAGFEDGTTGWTDLDAASTAIYRTGAKSGQETIGEGTPEEFYQDLTWNAAYRGRSFTLTAYAQTEHTIAVAKIGINDGVTTIYSSTTNTPDWVAISVTKVLAANATRLRITGYGEVGSGGTSKSAYWEDYSITLATLTLGVTGTFVEFNGSLYAADSKSLLKWDGTDWDVVTTFLYTITDLCVWGDYLFIGQGYAYKYWYMSTTDVFVESTISDGAIQFFSLVGSTLWGNQSAYQMSSSTNPLNGGSWTTETTIVSTATIITDLLNHPDTVLVAATNGLYKLTALGAVTDQLPQLHSESNAYTGVNLILWNGNIYVPTGCNSLYEYDISDGTVTTVTPSASIPGQVDFVGRTLAMWGDAEFLYVALDNGTKVEILAGRWETIATTEFLWHHIAEITLTDADKNVRACIISPLPTIKRLWLGCSSTTDGIYYLHHPNFYGDVTQDTNYQMNKSSIIVTPKLETKYKHIVKTFYSVTVMTKGCDANNTIAVGYQKAGGSSFTSLGTISASPEGTLYFPADITTKNLQLQFTLTSSLYTTTPQLKGYILRCLARPFDLESGRLTINENGEFRTFGGFETSWKHSEYRDTTKNFYSITALSEGLSTTNYITLEYKLDDDVSYTTHETLITESPSQVIYFPADTVGKELFVKFTMATTTGTLIAYIIDGILRPPRRKEMEFGLYLADKYASPTGGVKIEDASAMASILREIDKSKWPVELTFFDGQQYNATFTNLQEQLAMDATTKHKEYLFTVRALEALLK